MFKIRLVLINIQIFLLIANVSWAQNQSKEIVVDSKVVASDNQVKIACIGNSITYGDGVDYPDRQAYPTQLQKILTKEFGDKYIVGKFAVSARTMLRNGDYPLWNEETFSEALNFAPDVCIITLGTNDSKSYNWDKDTKAFKTDYLAMVDTFKVVNPKVKFVLCLPPPAYVDRWDIRDSVIVNGVIPDIKSIAKVTANSVVVDFYSKLVDYGKHFPDHIHPDVEGSIKMAEIIMDKINHKVINLK